MTLAQRDILTHALGLNYTKTSHRNHFATAPDCDGFADVEALVEAGLMRRGRAIPGGLAYYHVTEAGAAAIGVGLPTED